MYTVEDSNFKKSMKNIPRNDFLSRTKEEKFDTRYLLILLFEIFCPPIEKFLDPITSGISTIDLDSNVTILLPENPPTTTKKEKSTNHPYILKSSNI